MVYGPERFCSYQGYGSSFQCAGDFEDEVELDTETGMQQHLTRSL